MTMNSEFADAAPLKYLDTPLSHIPLVQIWWAIILKALNTKIPLDSSEKIAANNLNVLQ